MVLVQVIKLQDEVLEEVLAVEVTSENEDTLLATSARTKAHMHARTVTSRDDRGKEASTAGDTQEDTVTSTEGSNGNSSGSGVAGGGGDAHEGSNVNTGSSGAGGGGGGGGAPEGGWLEGLVPLPGGYKTTRRDVLKLLPLSGAVASFGFLLANAKVCFTCMLYMIRVCWLRLLRLELYPTSMYELFNKSAGICPL